MKIFASSHEFDYSWEEVSTANWRKYCPWNDKNTHVIAVDTISRRVDQDTGVLRTERLITCRQAAPRWIGKFLGGQDVSHVLETSYVDPAAKKVTMCSQNMTWSDLISCREMVSYRPSDRSPSTRTVFHQHAEIVALCGGWQNIKNKIEEVSVNQFKQNAIRGREGFEMVLEISRRVFADERQRRAISEPTTGAVA